MDRIKIGTTLINTCRAIFENMMEFHEEFDVVKHLEAIRVMTLQLYNFPPAEYSALEKLAQTSLDFLAKIKEHLNDKKLNNIVNQLTILLNEYKDVLTTGKCSQEHKNLVVRTCEDIKNTLEEYV